jgi:hypothetical protein
MSQKTKSTVINIPIKEEATFSERNATISYKISMYYEKLRASGMYPTGHRITKNIGENVTVIVEYLERE